MRDQIYTQVDRFYVLRNLATPRRERKAGGDTPKRTIKNYSETTPLTGIAQHQF